MNPLTLKKNLLLRVLILKIQARMKNLLKIMMKVMIVTKMEAMRIRIVLPVQAMKVIPGNLEKTKLKLQKKIPQLQLLRLKRMSLDKNNLIGILHYHLYSDTLPGYYVLVLLAHHVSF